MSKWYLAFIFTIITSNFLFAQQNNLEIKGTGANLSVTHTVVPKESFYSVARMYNVNPKEIAAYNQIQMVNGLKVGQDLKIPLGRNNFTQTGSKLKKEALIPVYHTIEPGETLYRLGVNYNKVSLASLKKWNHLQSDDVSVGTPMIVGYLKVDKALSSLANIKTEPAAQVAIAPKKEEKPVEKKPEVVVNATPAEREPASAKTENVAKTTTQTNENKVAPITANTKSNIGSPGGYFKNLYNQQNENKTPADNNGSAGVFKSTSGWQDSKYYCFSNDATPGTILKVTNNATGKSVYAKVLDAIPDIKQNSGLSIVISNSAAEELGAGENKFDCMVSFAK